MSLLESIFLGALQGITEFLPISSSGHLVVARSLLGIDLPGVQFEVALHLATLVSVLTVYRKAIRKLLDGLFRGERDSLQYLLMLIVACVPAAVLGAFGNKLLESFFLNPWIPVMGFSVTGLILMNTNVQLHSDVDGKITLARSVMIGLAQACALVPGISRSGVTVAMALWLGVKDEKALEFSFLASIPVILGAVFLQLGELQYEAWQLNWINLFAGMVVAGMTGIFAIKYFLVILRKRIINRFALYCFSLSAVLALYLTVMD